MSLPPPIPDPSAPFVKTSPIQKPQVAKASYAPIVAYALLVFGALWTVARVVPVWSIYAAVFGSLTLFSIVVILKTQQFFRKCDGVIRSRAELNEAFKLIDVNMKGAYLMMVVIYPVLALSVLRGASYLAFPVTPIFLLPIGLWGQAITRKFKAMSCSEANLSAEFADAILQFKEPQFGLKPFAPS